MKIKDFVTNGIDAVKKNIGKAAVVTGFMAMGLNANAQSYGTKEKVETDPHDFWAFSVGHINKGNRGLYTPKGLYWEGVMPFPAEKGSAIRRYTGWRSSVDLIKEGEFGYNYSYNVPGVTQGVISARKTFSEGSIDLLARYPIGTGSDPVQVQPYAYVGVGAGYLLGNTISTGNVTHLRYGVGAMGKVGFNANHIGFGGFVDVQYGVESRQNTLISNYLPSSAAYGGNKHFLQTKLGVYVVL